MQYRSYVKIDQEYKVPIKAININTDVRDITYLSQEDNVLHIKTNSFTRYGGYYPGQNISWHSFSVEYDNKEEATKMYDEVMTRNSFFGRLKVRLNSLVSDDITFVKPVKVFNIKDDYEYF